MKVEDYPGFETFGADVRAGREAQGITRKVLAEEVNIAPRNLASIELGEAIPSILVILQLVKICRLPAERYFNPGLIRRDSEQRRHIDHNCTYARKSICLFWKPLWTGQSV